MFSYENQKPSRPLFLRDEEGSWIRIDNMDKVWICVERAEEDKVNADAKCVYIVTATMKEFGNFDVYSNLKTCESEGEAQVWMDHLMEWING